MSFNSERPDAIHQLLDLMEKLRDPTYGCQWDRKQTLQSLTGHTLEEVYEVVDAVEQGVPEKLCDELGDLLFQIVFYARIASESDWFNFHDIANTVFVKLLHRHPHIFPDGSLDSFGTAATTGIDAQQVENNWEAIKNVERAGGDRNVSVLDDVPRALPAMNRARKLQKRAASKGFDWPDSSSVLSKLNEELAELSEAIAQGDSDNIAAEFGDVLFTCINLSRHLGVDPEQSLRGSNARFESRFRHVESCARDSGGDMTGVGPVQLELWWDDAKRLEKA